MQDRPETDAVKKPPASYRRLALSLGTSLIMSFLVSGVSTYRVLGLAVGMFGRWMESWMISWAIASPTMYFAMPLVRRVVDRVIRES